MSELRWPMDNESLRQAEDWAAGVSIQVLDWTWRAFDVLCANVLSSVDMTQPLEQLERDLTSRHFIEIQRIFGTETEGFSSIIPHHEYPENESRPGGRGKPPASDISFVWYENPRVSWPIEAKVVPTPGTLAEYLRDTKKFADGIAAPLVGEGAQVAYLLTGETDDFFHNISPRLTFPLQPLPEFSDRAHRVSSHTRIRFPDLQLHHMAMYCRQQKTA
jgi:hypothetical protein